MNILRLIFVSVCLLVLGVAFSFAQTTIQSNGGGGGAWDATTTWSGDVVPGNLDSVVILPGDSVWLPIGDTCAGLNIESGAKLAMYSKFVPGNVSLHGTIIAYADSIFEQGLVTVGNSGLYIHAMDGGRLPLATWEPGSTLLITGVTANVPVNRNQNFYNFTWNCPNQSSNLSMSWDSVTIGGDINILRTGLTARWYVTTALGGDSAVVHVMGNINVVRGSVSAQGTGNGTTRFVIFVHGNINVNGEDPSRDNCNFSVARGSQGGTGTTTWYLYGDFTMNNATAQNSNPTGARFVFVKPGTQILTLSASDSIASLPIQVASGTTLDVGTHVVRGVGIVVVDSGATLKCANISGVDGTFAGTGTKTFNIASNYIFDGSSTQATGRMMPDTLNNLTINNANGVTLSDSIFITGTLSTINGDFNLGNKLVTLSPSASLSETAGNTVIGTMMTSRDVAQSADETFGGIGLTVNAAGAAPGLTTVTRVTGTPQIGGAHQSILRYFDITPTTNSGLDATLDYFYDNSELNGEDASKLLLWKSTDNGSSWSEVASTVNTGLTRLRTTGLDSFSRFTAADSANALDIVTWTYGVLNSWNMISLPLVVSDAQKATLFPTSSSNAFYFQNGYHTATTIETGVGYWLKFPSAQNVEIIGTPILSDTIHLNEGWNMIGMLNDSVEISSVVQDPPGVVLSSYYGFNSGYVPVSSKLAPMRSYWIKAATGGGDIILSAQGFRKSTAQENNPLKSFTTITITDRNGSSQILYLGSQPEGNYNVNQYEMPPSPPAGILDARFVTQRLAEVYPNNIEKALSYAMNIQTVAYPVTVSWNVTDRSKSFTIEGATEVSAFNKAMQGKGSLVLQNPPTRIAISVAGEQSTPKQFSLSKNYPNPFNPSTTIDVALPIQSHVTLRVFNILGGQVAELASGIFDEGIYSFTWDGTNDAGLQVSTGVYFYKLETSSLSDGQHHSFTHKMVFMK